MKKSLSQRFYRNRYILYEMIYEIEIVTFEKIQIRALVLMSMLYSSEGRRKDKTKNKG